MKKRKAFHIISFVLAAMILALQLFAVPTASLRVQAAPVTFPDGTVFDPEYYADAYPEVKAAFGNDSLKLWLHYYQFGRAEGRAGVAAGTASKPPAAGKKVTAEQIASVTATAEAALKQQAAASPAANPATAKPGATTPAAKTPAAAVTFDPVFYSNSNPDIKKAFGSDAAMLWLHYRMFGEKEGRKAAANHVPGTKVTAPANVREIPIPGAPAKAAPTAATTPPAPAIPVIKSNGTRIAFIGDSITTFGGQLPPGYEPFYPWKGLENLAETWWYRVCVGKGLLPVVNASYSRSRVVGNRNDETGFVASSYARINTVAAGQPDIVFIMVGTNDFNAAINLAIFRDAYQSLVTQVRTVLPNATIVCSTCIPVFSKWYNAQDVTIDAYNNEIRTVALRSGCVLIDTWACGITNDMMIDGTHPNATGAAVMANFIMAHMPQIKKK
ncbi:MAG: SGNH/GDSL hydrolase family protein [Lachnospiraceae bacterium]|nr:SGNH/GDSL hydrolase family protein [Lachnospiraceae bacterium]